MAETAVAKGVVAKEVGMEAAMAGAEMAEAMGWAEEAEAG